MSHPMTRERVEQAIEIIAEALREFHAGAGYPDHYYAEDLNHALEALTTISNALAESERERERLQGWMDFIAKTQHRMLDAMRVELSDEEWDAFAEAIGLSPEKAVAKT